MSSSLSLLVTVFSSVLCKLDLQVWFCITAHRYLTEEDEEPNSVLRHTQMLLDFWGPHDEAYKEEFGN